VFHGRVSQIPHQLWLSGECSTSKVFHAECSTEKWGIGIIQIVQIADGIRLREELLICLVEIKRMFHGLMSRRAHEYWLRRKCSTQKEKVLL